MSRLLDELSVKFNIDEVIKTFREQAYVHKKVALDTNGTRSKVANAYAIAYYDAALALEKCRDTIGD